MSSLGEALQAARSQRRPMTLVCLSVPERDGAGLSRVAALTRNTVRDTDALWRDGERGLALLLADADGPTSEPALARLRLRLRGRGMGAGPDGPRRPAPGHRRRGAAAAGARRPAADQRAVTPRAGGAR